MKRHNRKYLANVVCYSKADDYYCLGKVLGVLFVKNLIHYFCLRKSH